MDLHLRNLEFGNHNSIRAYPIAVDTTRKDKSGTFRLPQDFLVGLGLSVHAGHNVDPGSFCIKSVSNWGNGFNLIVGYDTGTAVLPVAAAVITREGHRQYSGYRLGGIGDFSDACGMAVIDNFDNIDKQPPGEWQFDLDGTRLEPDAIHPQIRGVSSLQTDNGGDRSQRIYGDIILRAGKNMRITPVLVEGEDPVLVFDAISGEGLNEECLCANQDTSLPIYTIDGVGPTAEGDFTLLGSKCLEVDPITNGLQLKDVCSEPCCGCTELETVTRALEMFGQQATTLENFLTSLEARVTQMDQVVLGSKLGDRACNDCDQA